MSEDVKTQLFEANRWLEPVRRIDKLPTEDVREGHLCYVQEASAIYEYRNGKWMLATDASLDTEQ